MKTTCLESQILEKLNKILAQRNLKLVVSSEDVRYEFVDENFAPAEMLPDFRHGQTSWSSLDVMFFKNDICFTVFDYLNERPQAFIIASKNQNLDYYSDWAFHDIGLRRLENCASWEEVLLRLEVMYPDL